MNKLELISDSITDIREKLNAECVPIDELSDKITSEHGGGFTTAFIFNNSTNPSVPNGGLLDMETGLVTGLTNGWSNDTISKARSSNSELWMSKAVFNLNGERITDWNSPVNLKGIRGEQGVDGKQGEKGDEGPSGEKGEVVGYRTVFAYTGTDTEDTPSRPTGGHWDLATNTVIRPNSIDGRTNWVLNADDVGEHVYTWLSQATFDQDGSITENWCVPIRLTGKDGKNGVDGNNIEYTYRLIPDYDTYLKLREQLSSKKLFSSPEDDKVPPVNDSLNIDTVWTDSPSGISPEYLVEVMCTRTKQEGQWSDWSNCIMWAKWGEDGTDGDGVEYIYLITPAKVGSTKVTWDYVLYNYMPNLDEVAAREEYQQDEFCLNDQWGCEGFDWTDEPSDVGPGEPLEWVSVRKYRDGKWEKFSDPKLWATFTEDGYTYFTSFVFTRSILEPDRPIGGSYSRPYPDNDDIWEDSVPEPDGDKPVWISQRTFASNGVDFDDDWSEPKMLADSANFQVEYSADPNVTGDKITPYTGDEKSWRAAQPFKWGDDTEITDPIWMITSTCRSGIWSNWVLTRIKGEKGDAGEPGSSVSIKHKVETKNELLAEWNDFVNGGDFFGSMLDIENGTGVYVEEEGLLYIYSGSYYPGEDKAFDQHWVSVEIKGEPGDSAYLYIAFTDGTDETATLFFNEPKKYIGIKYSDVEISESDKKKWSTYMWSQWKGEDGWGQEQVFLLTSKTLGFDPNNNPLNLPSNNASTEDYLPTHSYGVEAFPNDRWSDSPISPSEEYPYCWVATRKKSGDTYGPWLGYNGKAALYSRHSYDGKNAIKIDLVNDLAVVPLENGKVDSDFKDEVSTIIKVYLGDEEVSYPNFSIKENQHITVDGNKIALKSSSLNSTITNIPITVTVGNTDYSVTWHILYSDVAYELIPDTYVLKRYVEGEYTGLLEKDTLKVSVLKWRDNKWEAAVIPIFAEVSFTDKSTPKILSTSENEITISQNGVATINLNGLKNVSEIKVYAVQKDVNGEYWSNGTILTYEIITIVSDGITGKSSGRTVFIYTKASSDELHYVDKPIGGHWDFNTHQMVDMRSNDEHIWSGKTPNVTKDQPFIWQCTGDIDYNGQLVGDWDHPSCITGAAGADGTFITPRGEFEKLSDLENEWSLYIKSPSTYNGNFILPLATGDSYCVKEDGHFWVYDGNGTTFEDAWIDVGKVQGESSKIYIRFSNNSTGNPMLPEGTPGPFIGIVATDPDRSDLSSFLGDYLNYTWTKWTGDDGFGQEQIFKSTKNYDAPKIPTSWEKTVDALPYGWSDKPISADEKNPYIWYVTRNTKDWTPKGDKDKSGYAALYAQYSAKGSDAVHLELTNDQVIIPLEDGRVDPDFINSGVAVGTTMVLYSGDSVLSTNVTYSVDKPEVVNSDKLANGVIELILDKISNVSEILCTATHNGQPYQKKLYILKTANAFDILTDKIVLERDSSTGYLVESDKYLQVWPKKWDGQKWADLSGKTLFVTCHYVDKDPITDNVPLDTVWQNKLDLSEQEKLSKIRLYLTPNDIEGGTELCFEEIGIVANGAPGAQGPAGEQGPQGEKGAGIASVTYKYLISDISDESEIEQQADKFTETRPAITELSSDKPYLWCQETTTYTDDTSRTIYYIETVLGKGETGRSAPLIYPAGVWDDDKVYVVSPSKVPYVWYESANEEEKGYYKAKDVDSEKRFSGVTPTNTDYWEQMEYMESIYSDIGVFNQALVGKWVFHENYMFSQEGTWGYYTNASGKKFEIWMRGSVVSENTSNYSDAIDSSLDITPMGSDVSNKVYAELVNQMTLYERIANGIWIPNICFNAVTGEGWYAGKKIQFNSDGSGKIGTGIYWDTNGTLSLSNAILFKSEELKSDEDNWNDVGGNIDLDEKQQWVLNTTSEYGTLYTNNSDCINNNITSINILNVGDHASRIENGSISFKSGKDTGMLVVPSNTLFNGMTYNKSCYCPSDYVPTKCTGGRDKTVTYLTPWENPGYDLKVHDYVDDQFEVTGTNMSSVTISSISYSCPKVAIEYNNTTLTLQSGPTTGENVTLHFTARTNNPGQYQHYINIYFYFNELCVGRYCISGNYYIYDDSDTH